MCENGYNTFHCKWNHSLFRYRNLYRLPTYDKFFGKVNICANLLDCNEQHSYRAIKKIYSVYVYKNCDLECLIAKENH